MIKNLSAYDLRQAATALERLTGLTEDLAFAIDGASVTFGDHDVELALEWDAAGGEYVLQAEQD